MRDVAMNHSLRGGVSWAERKTPGGAEPPHPEVLATYLPTLHCPPPSSIHCVLSPPASLVAHLGVAPPDPTRDPSSPAAASLQVRKASHTHTPCTPCLSVYLRPVLLLLLLLVLLFVRCWTRRSAAHKSKSSCKSTTPRPFFLLPFVPEGGSCCYCFLFSFSFFCTLTWIHSPVYTRTPTLSNPSTSSCSSPLSLSLDRRQHVPPPANSTPAQSLTQHHHHYDSSTPPQPQSSSQTGAQSK